MAKRKDKVAEIVGVLDGRRRPNCLAQNVVGHTHTGCILFALIDLIKDCEGMTEEKAHDLHANCAVDLLWDHLGPVINGLEIGQYNEPK